MSILSKLKPPAGSKKNPNRVAGAVGGVPGCDHVAHDAGRHGEVA